MVADLKVCWVIGSSQPEAEVGGWLKQAQSSTQ